MSPRNMIIDDKQEEIAVSAVGNYRSSSRNRGKRDESNQKIDDGANFNIKYVEKKELKSTLDKLSISTKEEEYQGSTNKRALSGGRPPLIFAEN